QRPTRKRAAAEKQGFGEDDDDDLQVLDVKPLKKRARKSQASSSAQLAEDEDADELVAPSKKGKKKTKFPEEKRLKQFRKQPPQAYSDIYLRATTQRMFVIERTRSGTEECPEETVELAGSTGNIYQVNICKVPTCNCPQGMKRRQCKHIIYVMIRVLRAPEDLQYQLALLSNELREIMAKAPPILSPENTSKDGNRKEIDGDCPICFTPFEPDGEEIVYCKAACGNNIHKGCFEQWAATKQGTSGGVTCPLCRTPWMGDDDVLKKVAKSGKKNAEGYVNVASELGISGQRDYSTYHPFWVR
ncbi:hypothetical protein NA57DRAFT_26498, partial [Rhizodiscina lignyota]